MSEIRAKGWVIRYEYTYTPGYGQEPDESLIEEIRVCWEDTYEAVSYGMKDDEVLFFDPQEVGSSFSDRIEVHIMEAVS